MKTCLKTGSTERAVGPTGESSVHIAPPEDALSLFGHDVFEDGLALCALAWVPGEEHEPGAVLTRRGQGDAEPAALAAEERVGHLDQDAGAVPRVDFAAAGPAVQQVLQHGERLADDRMRLSALDVHHEADPAGIVLVGRIVETLRGGQAWRHRHHRRSPSVPRP